MKKSIILSLLVLTVSAVLAQHYKVGDLYSFSDGGEGIVFYVHPDGSGGWVVALNDASVSCQWGLAELVPTLPVQNPSYFMELVNDTAGYTNTQIIRAYQQNGSYAAGVVDFDQGWYLPSTAQCHMLFSQLPFISSSLVNAGGTDLAYDRYWTSDQRDNSFAWTVAFGLEGHKAGSFDLLVKTNSCRVRAVRSFSYAEEQAPVSYLWSTGDTTLEITEIPEQTTTYTVTVSTPGGCADTVEHTIVVNVAEPQTFVAEICQGETYEDNGFSLSAAETSEPGVHIFTRVEDLGSCAVTHTLELMVNLSPHSEFEDTACGSYAWNGQTYTQSGDYTKNYPLDNGCDSVVTLHLIVSPQPEATITVTTDTICEGEEVTLQASNSSSGLVLHVPPVAIGDILCTDNSIVKPADWPVVGKTAKGIVFHVDNTGEHGWAVHLQDQGTNLKWGGYGIDIPALPNQTGTNIFTDLNGYSNTQAIRAAGNASTYPAAWAVDFNSGWYLPANGQLRVLLSVIVFVNATLDVVEGQQFPMNESFMYWSSTECSNIYAGFLRNNAMGGILKSSNGKVRSICSF